MDFYKKFTYKFSRKHIAGLLWAVSLFAFVLILVVGIMIFYLQIRSFNILQSQQHHKNHNTQAKGSSAFKDEKILEDIFKMINSARKNSTIAGKTTAN